MEDTIKEMEKLKKDDDEKDNERDGEEVVDDKTGNEEIVCS